MSTEVAVSRSGRAGYLHTHPSLVVTTFFTTVKMRRALEKHLEPGYAVGLGVGVEVADGGGTVFPSDSNWVFRCTKLGDMEDTIRQVSGHFGAAFSNLQSAFIQ